MIFELTFTNRQIILIKGLRRFAIRGQRGYVLLHKWAKRGFVDVTHEGKCVIRCISQSSTEKIEQFIVIDRINLLYGRNAHERIAFIDGHHHGIIENIIWIVGQHGQNSLETGCEGRVSRFVFSYGRKLQVEQLHERFQILHATPAAHGLIVFADRGTHVGILSGQNLLQVCRTKLSESAHGRCVIHQLLLRRVTGIHERLTSVSKSCEEDLVFFEVRFFHSHPCTIG